MIKIFGLVIIHRSQYEIMLNRMIALEAQAERAVSKLIEERSETDGNS